MQLIWYEMTKHLLGCKTDFTCVDYIQLHVPHLKEGYYSAQIGMTNFAQGQTFDFLENVNVNYTFVRL